MKKTDIGLGLYIMAAIVFLIIRLPSGLLDVFMALNIAIALVVLFNSIFSKEALDMSSFPTLLLFTTIFRISLNVSTTCPASPCPRISFVEETFNEILQSLFWDREMRGM